MLIFVPSLKRTAIRAFPCCRPACPWAKRRRPAGDELFRRDALDDAHDTGSVKRGGAQFEEKVGRVPPEYARGLIAMALNLLGDDGIADAQRRLREFVLGIKPCALADQELNDVVQTLIGGRVQRGPAELPGGIHVGTAFGE